MEQDTSIRFRKRASECRDLARKAGTEDWRDALLALAQDLDDEADKIDAEGAQDD